MGSGSAKKFGRGGKAVQAQRENSLSAAGKTARAAEKQLRRR